MKRFDVFGEYMFDLLFGPLKRGRRAVNQFRVFFRVMGREFDELKELFFRVRAESNVASASEVMLPVHGQDRDMPRLDEETCEGYRTRLSMKGIISTWAGTIKGIRYVLAAFGYEDGRVEPFYSHDPDRWAEFIIHLGKGNENAVRNLRVIYNEVLRVKEASSKLAYFVDTDREPFEGKLTFAAIVSSYSCTILEDTPLLVRDQVFHAELRIGIQTSSYSEETVLQAEEMILVADRIFEKPLSIAPVISSYTETQVLQAEGLILVEDRAFQAELTAKPAITSYKEEQFL